MTMYDGPGRDAMSSEYHGVNSAMWAGAPGTPGTGASVLLPAALIRSPWDSKGNLVRKEGGDRVDHLIAALGLTTAFVVQSERGPWHAVDPRVTKAVVVLRGVGTRLGVATDAPISSA